MNLPIATIGDGEDATEVAATTARTPPARSSTAHGDAPPPPRPIVMSAKAGSAQL
jgi:hypothetical protein